MRTDEAMGQCADAMPRDLFAELERQVARLPAPQATTLRAFVELAEAWRIAEALREHRGNGSATARALGIGRRTLYTKMERLGVGAIWGVREAPPVERGETG
jgi:DNA-binding NtrC family response regulator